MFKWFITIMKRLFTIGEANVNAIVDKFEEPIKMTEQGIRDLNDMHTESMRNLALIKSMVITAKKSLDDHIVRALSYEEKAKQLLLSAQTVNLDKIEADKLATLSLQEKEKLDVLISSKQIEYNKQNSTFKTLEKRVNELRDTIKKAEEDLQQLKARQITAKTRLKVNKQLANINSSSTLQMLERMKAKINEEESLAVAYGELIDENKTLDDEINKALEHSTISFEYQSTDKLKELKEKLGITEEQKTT
jgi:phage shock protein A